MNVPTPAQVAQRRTARITAVPAGPRLAWTTSTGDIPLLTVTRREARAARREIGEIWRRYPYDETHCCIECAMGNVELYDRYMALWEAIVTYERESGLSLHL